jgi:hypothetical protein
MVTCWVFAFNDFVFQSQPGRLKSPAVMMNALVMLSALFMLLSKDRNCGGGGVLIAVKDIFIVTSVPEQIAK